LIAGYPGAGAAPARTVDTSIREEDPDVKTLIVGMAVTAATALVGGSAFAADRPDLNGIWGGNLVAGGSSAICQKVVDSRGGQAEKAGTRQTYQGRTGAQQWVTSEQDCGVGHRSKLDRPQYKPQYWQEVRLHDYYADTAGEWIDFLDPNWNNIDGVPRMGPPTKIMQTANEVIFLYQAGNLFRVVPTDCRQWDPVMQYDQTTMGLSVGCYLDDGTLVVKSTAFSDGTWLDWNGYIHSNQMTVTETFKRQGDNLLYNVLVEDPVYLMQPWNMGQRSLAIQKDPSAQLLQDVPFVNRTTGNLTDPQYRG
jgi:hypothetical protein